MSKLFKLKEWLSIPDAARYLSGIFGDPVSEADILRLGLDGKLTLSVRIVNEVHVRFGRLAPLGELLDDGFRRRQKIDVSRSYSFDDEAPNFGLRPWETPGDLQFVHTENSLDGGGAVTRLVGVWDLPLIGACRIDIENRYLRLTDGPRAIDHIHNGLGGVFFSDGGEKLALLHEWHGSPDPDTGYFDPDNFYLPSELPEDCTLIVRTAELTRFQSELLEKPSPNEGSAPQGPWPWGTHNTLALGHLKAAAEKWWARYDPNDFTTAPINDDVAKWLHEERGVSKKMAESIASILRAEDLPAGPRR